MLVYKSKWSYLIGEETFYLRNKKMEIWTRINQMRHILMASK